MLTTRWPMLATGDDWPRRHRFRDTEIVAAWAEVLSTVHWQLFVTLTFDSRKLFPVGCARASREAFRWCNDACRMYRRPLGWVYAPERGKSGLWHVHALIVGAPSKIPEAAGVWKARNGAIDVECVHDLKGVTLYTSKQAALSGELVWSDTLGRYRDVRTATATVKLYG